MAGYIFGYATLASDQDYLVTRARSTAPPVWGSITGWRRRWNVATDNMAPTSHHKYYVDPTSRKRLEMYVVSLNVEPSPSTLCNGLAFPVDGAHLQLFDQRESYYDRVDVSAVFSEDLGAPVWLYRGSAAAVDGYRRGKEAGCAVIRADYKNRVENAFRQRGADAWRGYMCSTDQPDVPVREIDIIRAPGDGGI